MRILLATRDRRGILAQVATLGATQAIERYRVALGGRTVAGAKRRSSPYMLRIRSRRGGKLRVDALDRRGAVLSSATKKVRKVRTRKGNVRRGSRVGAEVWIR